MTLTTVKVSVPTGVSGSVALTLVGVTESVPPLMIVQALFWREGAVLPISLSAMMTVAGAD